MLDTLVTFVFYLITSVYSLLFAPFINIIFSLFPAVNTLFNNISAFILYAIKYLATSCYLICLPPSTLLLLFDYFLVKYSIYIIKLTIKLGVKIYHIFKP